MLEGPGPAPKAPLLKGAGTAVGGGWGILNFKCCCSDVDNPQKIGYNINIREDKQDGPGHRPGLLFYGGGAPL